MYPGALSTYPTHQSQKLKQRTKILDKMVVNLVPQGELVKSITMTMKIDPDLFWVEVTFYKEYPHF